MTRNKKTTSEIFRKPRAQTRTALESIGAVPSFGVRLTAVPGKYWTTHPGTLNVRWWWMQLQDDVTDMGTLLLDAWSLYLHRETSSRLVEKSFKPKGMSPAGLRRALSTYLGTLDRELAEVLERGTAALFSIRERIAWLAYEIARLHARVSHIAPGRIGYYGVLREVKRLHVESRSAQIDILHDALVMLDSMDVTEVMAHRHGSTHRLRVRAGEDPPPLFVEIRGGRWDSIQMGVLHGRRLLHLVDQTYHKTLRCLQQLATIETTPQIFTVEVSIAPFPLMPPFSEPHHGVLLVTEIGSLRLRCTNQCHGFVGEMDFDPLIDPKDVAATKAIAEVIENAILRAIPKWETEKGAGSFYYGFDAGGGGCIVFLINEKQRRQTMATEIGHRALMDIQDGKERGATPGWATGDESLWSDFREMSKWPDDAFPEVMTLMSTGQLGGRTFVRPCNDGVVEVNLAMLSTPPSLSGLLPRDPRDYEDNSLMTTFYTWTSTAVVPKRKRRGRAALHKKPG